MPTVTVLADVSAAGWVANPPGPLFDALNEGAQDNADYVFSAFLNAAPAIFSIPYLGPGTHTVSVAAQTTAGSTGFRISLRNDADVSVGTSNWQLFTNSWAVYTLNVVIAAGVASRLAIELMTEAQSFMSTEDGFLSTEDGYLSFV